MATERICVNFSVFGL